MKKLISFIKEKRTYFKAISMILVLALMVQTVSVAVAAITESDVYIGGSSELITDNETVPSIVDEVEENRDEFIKVYELQDGSFYEVTSTKPLHEKKDGKWVETVNDLSLPSTVDEVIEHCENLSEEIEDSNDSNISTFSLDIHAPSSDPLDFIVVNSTGARSLRLTGKKAMYLNIPCTRYGDYTYNQVTIDCKLYIDCQDIAEGNMYIHEIKQPWDINDATIKSNNLQYDNSKIIDTSKLLSYAPGEYCFNITDLYMKWEKGIKNNYGLAVKTDGEGKADIGGCYITRVYKTIDTIDSDFTYHTVDMGRAGKIYINDYTNSVVLARNELGLDGNVLPVELIRFFDFSKVYATTNPSGEGARWNYESKLKMVSSYTYSWETFEGSTINFIPGQSLFDWKAANGEEYELKLDMEAINNGDYSNVYIVSPDNIEYKFGKAGKVTTITDKNTNKEIIIKYKNSETQNTIDYIEDGLNRRYLFEYEPQDYKLNNGYDTTVNVLSAIYATTYRVEKNNGTETTIYNNIKLDGKDVRILYEYTPISNNHLALSKVTYPDNSFCSYEYDSNGCLSVVTDIDGRKLTLKYAGEIPVVSKVSNNVYNTSSIDVEQHPSVMEYTVEVKNIDDDKTSENYVQYLEKSTVKISRYNDYHRVFTETVPIGNNTDEREIISEEEIQYNNKLKILYMKNNKGDAYYADYSENNGNSYLSQVVSPENYDNLLNNNEFQKGTLEDWQFSGSSNPVEVLTDDNGNPYLSVEGNLEKRIVTCQDVAINGDTGHMFVVGGSAIINDTVPTPNRFVGIQVYKCVYDDDEEDYIATDEVLCSIPFDQTLLNEQQFRLGAFKLDEPVELVQFQFVCSAQTGETRFDDAVLYLSTNDHVSFFADNSDSNNSNSTIELNDLSPKNSVGLVTSEKFSNGETNMLSRYVYNDKYNISNYIDNNNITTSYEYDDDAGVLLKETVQNVNTEFSYTPMGALKEVSRAVSGLTDNANAIKTTYSYSGDRIESVQNQGMKYTFVYNSFGNVKSIEVEPVESSEATKTALISYDYSDNALQSLDSITYVNGDTLHYAYNESGDIISVSFSNSETPTPVEVYTYEYTNGSISKITDKLSNREVIYSGEDYIVKEYVESGNDAIIYYSVTTNENGQKVKTLFNNTYTYLEDETEYLSNTKETEYTSKYLFDVDGATASIETVSVSDYFGRTVKADASFSPASEPSVKYTLSNTKNYNDYNATIDGENIEATTNLISTHKSEITKTVTDSETNDLSSSIINSFTTTYTYDAAGRITHVYYSQSAGTNELASYYEYDAAGQLIVEVNPIEKTFKKYSYDSNGNVTRKEIYQGDSDFLFNKTTCTVFIPETSSPQIITYGYDNEQSDLLTSFNDHSIPLDPSKNPLKYFNGEDGTNTEYNLTWIAGLLSSVETVDGKTRYDYTYDANGLRTSKTLYSYKNSRMEKSEITNYIWEDNVLVGYQIYFCDETEPAELNIKIIYDEYNSPVGVHYTTVGLEGDDALFDDPDMAAEDVLWFIKDGQGNVKGIYSTISKYTVGCSYDATGNIISVDISGKLVDDIEDKINRVDEAWRKALLASLASLALAALTTHTLRMGQSTYRSYVMDMETGLYYCNNRYYSPAYGRFINMDNPVELLEDMENPLNANLFVYCNNDPINSVASLENSSFNLSAVGIQADMSSCFISPSGKLGLEMIYDWEKDEMYSYYYYGNGASTGYINRAFNYLCNGMNHLSSDSYISPQNLSNWFNLNWSISLNYFSVYTDKSFSWPYSYSGVAKAQNKTFNNHNKYTITGKGYQVYGISYSPISSSGFGLMSNNTQKTRISITSPDIKNYLSSNKNNIINAVS